MSVVYLSLPTSNHNWMRKQTCRNGLYIFRFLHQTTTWCFTRAKIYCCISFASYIKPQPNTFQFICVVSCISFASYIKPQLPLPRSVRDRRCISFASYIKPQPFHITILPCTVVYLSLPTSNHNGKV